MSRRPLCFRDRLAQFLGSAVRKIIPVVVAGATALAVAGGTFGYVDVGQGRHPVARRRRSSRSAPWPAPSAPCWRARASRSATATWSLPAADTKLADGTEIAVRFGRQVTFTVDGAAADRSGPRRPRSTRPMDGSGHRHRRRRAVHQPQHRHRPGRPGRRHRHREDGDHRRGRQEAERSTTTAQTVAEALAAAKITVDGNDKLSAEPTAQLEDGTKVRYTRVDVKTKTKKSQVAYNTVRKEPKTLDTGNTKVDTAGVNGRPHPHLPGRPARRQDRQRQADRAVQGHQEAGEPGASWSAPRSRRSRSRVGSNSGGGQHTCLGQRLGPAGPVRVRRQLVDQHRQRLLRRAAVLAEHLARVRRHRAAAPEQQGPADRGRARSSRPPRAGASGRPAPQAGPSLSLLDPCSAVRDLARRLDLRPSKQRGQNFVTDANTVRRIVAASGVGPDDVVLEIGPGLGSLTLGLLAVGRPGRRGGDRRAAGRGAAARPWPSGCRTGPPRCR